MNTKIVIFEGPDLVGKTTTMNAFSKYLTSVGKKNIVIRQPGSTELGESLRNILLMKKEIHIDPLAQVLMFEASRIEAKNTVIKKYIDNGYIILLDRWSMSSQVYQSAEYYFEHLNKSNELQTTTLTAMFDLRVEDIIKIDKLPDENTHTVLLNAYDDVLKTRDDMLKNMDDRYESAGIEFKEKVLQHYRSFMVECKSNQTVVNNNTLWEEGELPYLEKLVFEGIYDSRGFKEGRIPITNVPDYNGKQVTPTDEDDRLSLLETGI